MKISFIGGGNMAHSIIGGIVKNNTLKAEITVFDINQTALDSLKKIFAVTVFLTAAPAINNADVIIFAIKPQVFKDTANSLKNDLPSNALLISIAAGISSVNIRKWLDTKLPIVRTMPNTPALIAKGMTGIFTDSLLTDSQKTTTDIIFNSIGRSIWVLKENELNIITAISGSGPAYFFLLFEAMEEIAVKLGIDKKTAQLLTQQTALGAATMAINSNKTSTTLKEMVVSKGGTTEKALDVLDDTCWTQSIQTAIKSAYKRSIELQNEIN